MNAETDNVKENVDPKHNTDGVDDIFTEEIGEFGLYQVLVIVLCGIYVVFNSWSTTEYVFTTARIPTRCFIPQCDQLNPNYATPWITNAIPARNESFDNCQRYGNNSLYSSNNTNDCPIDIFNHDVIKNCDGEYVYENTDSIVYDFNLACQEWRRSFIGTAKTFGYFLNLPLTGFISDRWGRKVALFFNSMNTCWVGLVRSLINSYEWFVIMEVLEATLGAGPLTCCYILVAESVRPKYRAKANLPILGAFSVGQITMAFIASAVKPWRSLLRVMYGPQLVVLLLIWFVPESIRWSLKSQDFKKTEKILLKMAKINRKQISAKLLAKLKNNALNTSQKEPEQEVWLPILVLRNKTMLLRCIVSPIWWITTTLMYYGISINSVEISGNSYLNFAIVSAVEVPGHLTGGFLSDRFGRKPILMFGFSLGCLMQLLIAFLPTVNEAVSLTLFVFGKYSVGIIAFTVYNYTAELYPTKYRHSLFAYSSMMGRIGAMIAPLTPALALMVWSKFPSVLFGSMALLSCLLTLLMPETLGTKLPDTMDQAANIQNNKFLEKNINIVKQ